MADTTPKKPERMTDREASREMFLAGYLHALDDVAESLAIPKGARFLARLRAKAARSGKPAQGGGA